VKKKVLKAWVLVQFLPCFLCLVGNDSFYYVKLCLFDKIWNSLIMIALGKLGFSKRNCLWWYSLFGMIILIMENIG
jgi:hypothetical protein